jgi:uncharacterized protein (TIGR02145 family)
MRIFYAFAILAFHIILISCKKDETPPPQVQPKASVKPVVSTDSTVLITDSSARIRGRIISAGSDTIQLAGMEWKGISEPESAYRRLPSDSSVFHFDISNLEPGTRYQTRAFASSAAGISYGTVLTFKTDTLPVVVCPATVTDASGNVYQVIRIGTQCWMKENLRSTKFRSGTDLKSELTPELWASQPVGAYCSYGDNPVNANTYGFLYNQYAVTDGGKICPEGWHVPTDADWATLENYLGGASLAGGKLKSMSTAPSGLWAGPNTGASNSSGFDALPAGRRLPGGAFQELGQKTYWWCSGPQGSVKPRSLSASSAASMIISSVNRADGYSIRCVAD